MTMVGKQVTDVPEHVFKIYWPMHLCSPMSESGYLVGWNLGLGGIVVASKVSYASADQISAYLSDFYRDFAATEHRRLGMQVDGPVLPPRIVGYLSREGEGLCEPDVCASCAIWVDVFTARTQVAFRAIRTFGQAVPGRVVLMLYDESMGKPWHFYTASPICLDLTKLSSTVDFASRNISYEPGESHHDVPLQRVLDHINTTGQLHKHLEGEERQHEKPSLRTIVWNKISRGTGAQTIARSQETASALFAWFCSVFLLLSSYFLRAVDIDFLGGKLKDFSAVCQQLSLIVRRLAYLMEQWHASYYSRKSASGRRRHNAQYASFWNSFWVIALDLIIGCVLGTYLIMHSQRVSEMTITGLRVYTVTSLEQTIDWLRRWPAGLKLNNGLDGFLAELFLWLIHFWTVIFQPFTRCLRAVVIVAGWSGFVGGCSMQLAVLSDTLTLATLHTYWFYMVATRIFHWQLVTLYSLFNLFRGRKHNVLRNRIDSCDYDLDQLLIGTILFTLLTYLFPTVLVYYVTFASRRLAIIMAQGLLEILLGILNHCPVFYMMLRIRDPQMFPGGVSYDINCKSARRFIESAWILPGSPVQLSRDPIPLSARSRLNVAVVQMRMMPMPFAAIFFQYYHIWTQFSANYLSFGILRSLVVGDVIRPFPRLQHTMVSGVLSPKDTIRSGNASSIFASSHSSLNK
ncbi:pig-Q [Coemansia sp. RSA 1722]|nr:pig-Q [Coemansia sp. RSA 1722]